MNREKLWNRNYNKVMVTNFTLFFSFYLLAPILPLYLSETFQASKDMIGIVLSGYTVAALLVRPLCGFVVDSFPRKAVLLICLFLYFILFGGYIVAGGLLMFAIVRTLHGAPFGASTVANSTMAIDVLPSSRRKEGIGLYGLSNNLASAIAPTVGLYVYKEIHNFDILFWIAFLTAGIGFYNALTLQCPPRIIQKKRIALSMDRFFLFRGWFMALNVCLFGFCWGVLSNYLAIYSKECMHITEETGSFFLMLSVGLIVSRLQGQKSLREGRLLRNAFQGIFISTAGYILFVVAQGHMLYYLSAILIGLGNGHMWPAFQNMIIAMAERNERGTANSTLLTSWDLGIGAGVLLGGIVAEYWNFRVAFCVMAIVHVIALLIYLCLTVRKYRPLTSS